MKAPWTLKFEHPEIDSYSAEAGDLFDNLQAIRLYLEQLGWWMLCNGARKDVYPSGMSRESVGGRTVHRMRMGERVHASDHMDMFDPCDREALGSVREQNAFFEAWLATFEDPE
jgi:hypothetical protein